MVRHGQSELNVAKLLEDVGDIEKLKQLSNIRDTDISLTELGKFQAEETGKFLMGNCETFDIIYSSPYNRTLQTAEHIRSQFNYGINIWKDNRIREKEFGYLHGMPDKKIEEEFAYAVASRKRDGKYWHRLPGGENYPDVEMRMHSMLGTLSRDWPGRNVLLVTHHVPYLLVRGLYEHLGEKELLALGEVPNCAVQEYVIDTTRKEEGRLKLVRWNHVAYK